MTRIAIFSHKALLIDSISLMLNTEDHLEVTYTTNNYLELIHKVQKLNIGVLIYMDSLANKESLRIISEFKSVYKKINVLILSESEKHALIRESYLIGSAGYISTSESRHALIEAINTVSKGQQFFGKVSVKALMAKDPHKVKNINQVTQLTNREKEIVLLILEEKSSAQIAALLYICIGTVESHRHNIKKKLKVKSSIGVVKYALRVGLSA